MILLKPWRRKIKSIHEATNIMSESELISMYRRNKRNGDFLAKGNAIIGLKHNYGYTDEDIKNL